MKNNKIIISGCLIGLFITFGCVNKSGNDESYVSEINNNLKEGIKFIDLSKTLKSNYLHSINYTFDYDSNLLYFRNNWDSILYKIDFTNNLILDSIVLNNFFKSSLVFFDKNLYVISFSDNNGTSDNSVSMFKLVNRSFIRENSYSSENNKDYKEVDILKKKNNLELKASDFNNNLLYCFNSNSKQNIYSGIQSLDDTMLFHEYYWKDDSLYIKRVGVDLYSIYCRNDFDLEFNKKYFMFEKKGAIYIVGTSYDFLKIYKLNINKNFEIIMIEKFSIPCFGASVKVMKQGIAWFCNKKLFVYKWKWE